MEWQQKEWLFFKQNIAEAVLHISEIIAKSV